MKRQLALILARAQTPLEWLQVINKDDDTAEELPEDIVECLSNSRLSTQFKEFGKELGVLDPKSLEDVYKSHLENARTTSNVDSARGNLASTFVNAFVNAGFGNDKLMVQAEEGNSWIYKNKDHGSHRFIFWRIVLNRSMETFRDDERRCQFGTELAVGHRRWIESRR
jgi:26S proteasome regulatory subunit N1